MHKNKKIISIIVITYNHENFIRQCIDSILSQKTKYSFEIIIGDDASTDSTQEIIIELQKKYPETIKVINEKNHIGFIPNYIRTLKYCQGDYIAFCEGDDYWINENKLEKQVVFLQDNPEYGLVYTDYTQFNERVKIYTKNYLATNKFIPIEGFQPEKMVRGDNQIMTLTTCIRASLLGTHYFEVMNDENLLIADFPTWLWIGLISKIHFEPDVTAVYRVHKDSITNSHTQENSWKFHRSHQYIRKKIMVFSDYYPNNWKMIDCQIQRELMDKSLKLKFKQLYGIAAFQTLKKYNAVTLTDYVIVAGLYFPLLTWPVRIAISLIRRLKLKLSL